MTLPNWTIVSSLGSLNKHNWKFLQLANWTLPLKSNTNALIFWEYYGNFDFRINVSSSLPYFKKFKRGLNSINGFTWMRLSSYAYGIIYFIVLCSFLILVFFKDDCNLALKSILFKSVWPLLASFIRLWVISVSISVFSYLTYPNSSLINFSCLEFLGDSPFENIVYCLPDKSDLTLPNYPFDLSKVSSYMLIS